MDFSGATPMEAVNRLASFVVRLADATGVELRGAEQSAGSLLHEQHAPASIAATSFYIELNFYQHPAFVKIQHRANPAATHFGSGRLTNRGASIVLELRLDRDGLYRWYGVPLELTEKRQEGHPVARAVPAHRGIRRRWAEGADGFLPGFPPQFRALAS